MQGHVAVAAAGATTGKVVRDIGADHLDAPTPCKEFTVRDLLGHLLLWGPAFEAAARKGEPVGPSEGEPDRDAPGMLAKQIDRVVAAWSDERAWAGTTRFGSPEEVPAALIGGMACTELVLHGWDLARAAGQESEWDEGVVAFVYQELAGTAEQGREMGLYGPAVAVPNNATTLERALALSGRDPRWAPASPS